MEGAVRTMQRTDAKAGLRERCRGDLDDTSTSSTTTCSAAPRAWLDRWLRA
jgi:hypothetical protein